mmetsp:Transcript_3524/g.12692  ORF Transcript_3524/g.12692 Transcript_3524/m.12692 type:complete len:131 (+) Transcript_3524:96-488(+)
MGYSGGIIAGVVVCAVIAAVGIAVMCYRQRKLSKERQELTRKAEKAWPEKSACKSQDFIASQQEKEEQVVADIESQRRSGTPISSLKCNCGNADGKYGTHKWSCPMRKVSSFETETYLETVNSNKGAASS